MSKTFKKIHFLILLVALTTPCSKIANGAGLPKNHQYLYQSWRRSYEEETSTDFIYIYRLESYEFPPSRFRDHYIFREDGYCKWYVLSPDDGHYFKWGRWETSENDAQVILIYDEEEQLQNLRSFIILDLQKDLLKIEPVEHKWTPY
tara:strand:+ start:501 stop:941 length:441 start_codon:yes stop_codon:yes gene_type:complete